MSMLVIHKNNSGTTNDTINFMNIEQFIIIDNNRVINVDEFII